jgi:hypothetical protein
VHLEDTEIKEYSPPIDPKSDLPENQTPIACSDGIFLIGQIACCAEKDKGVGM